MDVATILKLSTCLLKYTVVIMILKLFQLRNDNNLMAIINDEYFKNLLLYV